MAFSFYNLLQAVWYFLEGYRRPFLFWTFILFIGFFYPLIPPLLIAKIIDFFTSYQPGESLHYFYLLVIILGSSHGLVSLVRLTSKNKIGDLQAEIQYNARTKGFERLLDFSLTWHEKENSGNKVQRIHNGTTALTGLIRFMGQTGYKTLAIIVGIFIIFIFLNFLFVLFLIVYLFVFICIHFLFYKKMQEAINEYNKAQEKASGSYYEGLNNVVTIKTLGAKETFKKNIYASEERTKKFNHASRNIGITKWKAFQLWNALSITVYLLLLGSGVINGSISIGSIFIFYTYLMRLTEGASDITDIIDELIESKSTIARMMPIYWEKLPFQEGNSLFPINWKSISISQGYFSYGKNTVKKTSNHFALKNINVTIQRNDKLGVVGRSGGGKSTFAKLLLGLYNLEHGLFLIDQVNFYDIKHSEVTKKISTVLQESEMFNLSLRENISLLRYVPPELFQKAIKIAQLEELIKKLPEGLETFIGEKGYKVSGGERQRIGIARAICKDPDILILDEATSALDSSTESKIQKALEQELKKKTLIIIAHRISTLRNVDKIIVFDKGRIVESGSYLSLVKNPQSKFYQVYKMQSDK